MSQTTFTINLAGIFCASLLPAWPALPGFAQVGLLAGLIATLLYNVCLLAFNLLDKAGK